MDAMIVLKRYLDEFELREACKIVCENMQKLGHIVTPKDQKIWKENITNSLENKDFYFYLVYFNGKICGFAELTIFDKKLFVAEIELNNEAKNTRILYKILQFLFNAQEFNSFTEVYFNINNKNEKSISTFSHLGGILVEKREKSSLYCLTRANMQKYFEKLNR